MLHFSRSECSADAGGAVVGGCGSVPKLRSWCVYNGHLSSHAICNFKNERFEDEGFGSFGNKTRMPLESYTTKMTVALHLYSSQNKVVAIFVASFLIM